MLSRICVGVIELVLARDKHPITVVYAMAVMYARAEVWVAVAAERVLNDRQTLGRCLTTLSKGFIHFLDPSCIVMVTASSRCVLHARIVLNASILHFCEAIFPRAAHQISTLFHNRVL